MVKSILIITKNVTANITIIFKDILARLKISFFFVW